MSYNINLQHIIFRTENSECTIPHNKRKLILSYINSVSRDIGVKIIRMNAHLNHVHILTDFPVTMLLPEYVRKIKQTSSTTFKRHPEFPYFRGWARGYGSFSVSHYEKEHIVNYIKSQDEHHGSISFAQELEDVLGIELIANNPQWQDDWLA